MKKYKWVIILLNLFILLIYFNYSTVKKEELLEDGKLILLQLAPVDPRSLMQGDYMTLRYEISQINSTDAIPKRGYCVIQLDNNNIARKVRLQKERTPLNKDEYIIAYTSADLWNINIGAGSFFFQEGQAEKYNKAVYGGVKIDNTGNSLLLGLYDEQLRKIE